VVDVAGDVVLRSEAAERFTDPRHVDAIAAEVITELLDRARVGESARRELQLFGPPRQVLLVEALPLLRSEATVGAVAFVRDVSEARRVENVRRDFVANVSHELKTPIGALALLAETVAMGDDPAIAQQLAERMVREADRLGRIIDDLLDLSLIEAQETPTRDPVPVHVLLNDAVDHVREAADLAGIPIVVAPVPTDLVVRCDRRQVVSGIANLLDNAIKYSDPGRPVELDGRVEGERVALTVRDHGIGIPSRDLERIFERFYRVDRARSRATGGTGLGLSIVRHVAQAHGGEVGVESREGEGSTFTLLLPTARRHTGGTDLKVS
jgi:two-component system sensor histidine kinase SenX3